MGKIRKWFREWFDRQLEKSFERESAKCWDRRNEK